MPLDHPEFDLSAPFEARLPVIEAAIQLVLDQAPGRIRYQPIMRALWRVLLLPAPYVLWLYRRQLRTDLKAADLVTIGEAAHAAGDQAGYERALDALALTLVARAVLGDARAAARLFDRIEGRPGPRRPDRSSDPLSVDLEPIVRLLYERR